MEMKPHKNFMLAASGLVIFALAVALSNSGSVGAQQTKPPDPVKVTNTAAVWKESAQMANGPFVDSCSANRALFLCVQTVRGIEKRPLSDAGCNDPYRNHAR